MALPVHHRILARRKRMRRGAFGEKHAASANDIRRVPPGVEEAERVMAACCLADTAASQEARKRSLASGRRFGLDERRGSAILAFEEVVVVDVSQPRVLHEEKRAVAVVVCVRAEARREEAASVAPVLAVGIVLVHEVLAQLRGIALGLATLLVRQWAGGRVPRPLPAGDGAVLAPNVGCGEFVEHRRRGGLDHLAEEECRRDGALGLLRVARGEELATRNGLGVVDPHEEPARFHLGAHGLAHLRLPHQCLLRVGPGCELLDGGGITCGSLRDQLVPRRGRSRLLRRWPWRHLRGELRLLGVDDRAAGGELLGTRLRRCELLPVDHGGTDSGVRVPLLASLQGESDAMVSELVIGIILPQVILAIRVD
mmetsp:Transcript_48659/g.141859  ORF Transcript_48659/g.141859 Transcript_48659/m.141859 type:complete len:369 (+) Transcript_48659:2606-3712(+)